MLNLSGGKYTKMKFTGKFQLSPHDGPTPHPLNLPGNLLHLSSLGNIDQLPKSITDLNLSGTKLEGR